MCSVLILSTQRLNTVQIPLFPGIDKVVHFTFYGIMVIVFAWAYYKLNQLNLSKLLIAVYWSILFGGLIELIQHYLIDGRTGDWADFAANTIGALFGSYIVYKKYLTRTTQK